MNKFWNGAVPPKDDFNRPIRDEFIDGKTKFGPWAFMTPASWKENGIAILGTGCGQRYRKQKDGRYLKVEG
jgi:hypothetical protein